MIAYENGAKLKWSAQGTTAMTGQMVSSSGQVCATMRADISNSTDQVVLTITPTGGEDYVYIVDAQTQDTTIRCPGGQELTFTAAETDQLNACFGNPSGESRCGTTGTGGGGTPGTCTAEQDNCQSGMECCAIGAGFACVSEGTCPDLPPGCQSDSDCQSGLKCCNFGAFSTCAPAEVCP